MAVLSLQARVTRTKELVALKISRLNRVCVCVCVGVGVGVGVDVWVCVCVCVGVCGWVCVCTCTVSTAVLHTAAVLVHIRKV